MKSKRGTFRTLFLVGLLGLTVASALLAAGQTDPVAAASATWQPHALPSSPVYPKTSFTATTGISCPSAEVCFVTGEYGQGDDNGGPASMYATTDGGAKWAIQTLPASANWLSSISCPSTSECVTVTGEGSSVLRTVNGGTTWTTPSLPAAAKAAYGLEGVTCPTVTTCFAVAASATGGVIIRSTDGGAKWQVQTAPHGTNYYQSISCSSSSTCTIVGGNLSETTPPPVLTTTDGGAMWRAHSSAAIVTGESLGSVSCPTKDECFVAGGVNSGGARMFRTTNGGTSWAPVTLPSGLFGVGVSCISATTCFALGSDGTGAPSGPEKVLTTTNAGTTWQTQTFAQSGTSVADVPIINISCTTKWCFGAGEHDGPAFYTYLK
jgi:photosystem II stability/assembly factor-like uncharacterized protein